MGTQIVDPAKSLLERAFVTSEGIQQRLQYLRDQGVSWPKISRSDEFRNIPPATLYDMLTSGRVPKKWWRTLKVRGSQPPRIAVHKEDVPSAVRSILNNIDPDKVAEISYELRFVENPWGEKRLRFCPNCKTETTWNGETFQCECFDVL